MDGVLWLLKLYAWTAERLYDELAWAYDGVSWLVSLGRWAEWRRAALDHVTGGRVLEVGFGTGELLIEAAARGLDVWGLERSPAMQKITARKVRWRGLPSLRRICGITQRMPFADGSFDSILSTFPSGYILDPATLREVARVLRAPAGRLVVVGLAVETKSRFLRQVGRLLFGAPASSVAAAFERAAAEAGLRVTPIFQNGDWFILSTLLVTK